MKLCPPILVPCQPGLIPLGQCLAVICVPCPTLCALLTPHTHWHWCILCFLETEAVMGYVTCKACLCFFLCFYFGWFFFQCFEEASGIEDFHVFLHNKFAFHFKSSVKLNIYFISPPHSPPPQKNNFVIPLNSSTPTSRLHVHINTDRSLDLTEAFKDFKICIMPLYKTLIPNNTNDSC